MQHYQWFAQGTAVASTNKAGCHDIAEIGVKHNKIINESINNS
jgi:hypothetical protein